MCNKYDLSILRVFTQFDEHSPKTVSRLYKELGDDALGLVVYGGQPLSKLVENMAEDHYLIRDGAGFRLTAKGLRERSQLEQSCQQH